MAVPLILFTLTFLIEFLIVWIFLRKEFSGRKSILLGYIFLINLFTWPIANLAYVTFEEFWLIEMGVILVETVLIMQLMESKFKKALLIAFIVNIITALLSYLSFSLFAF